MGGHSISEAKRLIRAFQVALCLPLFGGILLFSGATTAQERLLLSGHPDYPPFTWEQDGKIVGACPQMMTLILAELGVEVESRYMGNWKRVQFEAQNGNLDMIACLYLNEAREQYLDFSTQPFADDKQVVWVWKGKGFPFAGWEDLIDKVGTAPIGESFGEAFDHFIAEKLTIERVPRLIHNFRKLEAGRVDYFPYGLYAAQIIAERDGYADQLEYLPHPLITNAVYFALAKTSRYVELRPQIEETLRHYLAQGRVDQIIEQNLVNYVAKKRRPSP